MRSQHPVWTLLLSLTLAFTLSGGPELAYAAEGEGGLPDAPSIIAQNVSGQGPIGGAASVPQESTPTQTSPASNPQSRQRPAEPPAGAAGAQAGETAGSSASTPAGSAIAPVPQRQSRSILIRVGAI